MTRVLVVHVQRLRSKASDPERPEIAVKVRGVAFEPVPVMSGAR